MTEASLLSYFQESVDKDNFLIHCGHFSFEPKGISAIEGFYLWSCVQHFRPSVIFESGTRLGGATLFLTAARHLFGVQRQISCDRSDAFKAYVEKKFKYDAVDFFHNVNSYQVYQKEIADEEVFVFIDGPKCGEDLDRLLKVIARTNWVGVIMHDCYPGGQAKKDFKRFCVKYFEKKPLFLDKKFNEDLQDLNKGYEKWYDANRKPHKRKKALDIVNYIGVIFNEKFL